MGGSTSPELALAVSWTDLTIAAAFVGGFALGALVVTRLAVAVFERFRNR